ncbi:MAG TPA: hypothetical protein PK986_10345 [Spirochaetota bacterium]|nr:hypothetical protein [Spirochaetota bacterium]HQO40858.1 hypothetical protein [Spirochaetota bacterium]
MNNKLDSKSFSSRVKDLVSISGFIIAAAVVSTLIMDLIVFPLTIFAIRDVPSFNNLIRLLFTLLILFLMIYPFISISSRLKKEGHDRKYIVKYLIRQPFYHIGLLLLFLALCALIIAAIYLLFSTNYYYLHRISGGA